MPDQKDAPNRNPERPVGILVCAAGRFLVCRVCGLRIIFPSDSHFADVFKQLQLHSCSMRSEATH
jgi:hypothetical protein